MKTACVPVLVAVLAAGVGCASATPRADFGIGTERVSQVGNRMISWGYQHNRYVEGKAVPAFYQPTSEVVYAGVQSSSIVLNHLHYRSVVIDGWGSTSWVLAGSQTTYHPVGGKTLTVEGVSMDVTRADGNSIHFVVKSTSGAPSTTLSGPTQTLAGPEPMKPGETPKPVPRYGP